MKSLILVAAFVAGVFSVPLVGEAGGSCLNGQCFSRSNVQRVVVQRQAVVAPARVNVNVGRGFARQRVNINVR